MQLIATAGHQLCMGRMTAGLVISVGPVRLPERSDYYAAKTMQLLPLTPTTRVPCSNAAKTRNPLKFAGVPQTRQQISAVSRPKFTILWEHVEELLMFNKFFPIVNRCFGSEDIARQICAMVPKWRFLRPVFPASRVQHISHLHFKSTLGPHHVWKYGRHPICGRWD